MKIKKEKSLKIKLSDSDSDNFKSAIKKIINGEVVIGFNKKLLSEDELKVLKELNENIN
jgi:hypothetical protein